MVNATRCCLLLMLVVGAVLADGELEELVERTYLIAAYNDVAYMRGASASLSRYGKRSATLARYGKRASLRWAHYPSSVYLQPLR